MSKQLDNVVEDIKKKYPQISNDTIDFFAAVAKMGKQAAEKKDGVGEDALNILAQAALKHLEMSHVVNDDGKVGICVFKADDLGAFGFSMMCLGIGLAINEEIR